MGVIVHDLYSRGVKETGAAPATVARLVGIIESWTMKLSSGTVVVHERFIDSLVGIGVTPTNLRVVRNWVHVNQEAQERRADVRDGLGWGADDIVVLHSGNMGVKQGLENVAMGTRSGEIVQLVRIRREVRARPPAGPRAARRMEQRHVTMPPRHEAASEREVDAVGIRRDPRRRLGPSCGIKFD